MLEIKNVKKIQIRRSRFGYESESEYYSSCKNHESESEYSGFGEKDSNPNPNPNIRYNTGQKVVAIRKQVASGKLFIHFPDYAAGGVSAQEWIFCFNYCIDIPSCGETAL